jgi:enoyl-CoA hydratase
VKLKFVIYKRLGNIAMIKLNRPKVNACVPELYSDVITAIQEASHDSEVKVMVITGQGRCFSAGADIKVVPGIYHSVESYWEHCNNTIQAIPRLIMAQQKPIIAACHGYALGGGLEIALNADIRIAAEGSRFGFPEASVGAIISKGSIKILTSLVGLGRAKELILTSRLIDSEEAYRIGLVNLVVPVEKMEEAAINTAGTIADYPALSVQMMRSAANFSMDCSFENMLQLETLMMSASVETMKRGMAEKTRNIGAAD